MHATELALEDAQVLALCNQSGSDAAPLFFLEDPRYSCASRMLQLRTRRERKIAAQALLQDCGGASAIGHWFVYPQGDGFQLAAWAIAEGSPEHGRLLGLIKQGLRSSRVVPRQLRAEIPAIAGQHLLRVECEQGCIRIAAACHREWVYMRRVAVESDAMMTSLLSTVEHLRQQFAWGDSADYHWQLIAEDAFVSRLEALWLGEHAVLSAPEIIDPESMNQSTNFTGKNAAACWIGEGAGLDKKPNKGQVLGNYFALRHPLILRRLVYMSIAALCSLQLPIVAALALSKPPDTLNVSSKRPAILDQQLLQRHWEIEQLEEQSQDRLAEFPKLFKRIEETLLANNSVNLLSLQVSGATAFTLQGEVVDQKVGALQAQRIVEEFLQLLRLSFPQYSMDVQPTLNYSTEGGKQDAVFELRAYPRQELR